jgi:hypothetical protein
VKLILRGFALVVTDRRWAAPLSAAALGFGIFAGVAIGPGATGTLATGAQQIVQLPSSGGDEVRSGGGGGPVVSTGSSPPLGESEGSGYEEAVPSVPLAPEPVEPAPAPEPTPKPAAAPEDEDEADEEAQALKGTVVHANPAAGSYTMAVKGELVSIHAPKLPEPGTKQSGSFTRLANDTFAAEDDAKAEKKQAAEATFRGVITYTNPDPAAPTYTLSGRGSSLLIHVPPDPTGAAPTLPPIGTYATVTATLDNGLVQKKLEPESGPPSTYLDLAAIVKEVSPDGHLLLSADDAGESEADLTLTVPQEIDTTKLKLGDSYLATAEVDPNGPLKLSGIASDEHTKGADDPASAQGDLKR